MNSTNSILALGLISSLTSSHAFASGFVPEADVQRWIKAEKATSYFGLELGESTLQKTFEALKVQPPTAGSQAAEACFKAKGAKPFYLIVGADSSSPADLASAKIKSWVLQTRKPKNREKCHVSPELSRLRANREFLSVGLTQAQLVSQLGEPLRSSDRGDRHWSFEQAVSQGGQGSQGSQGKGYELERIVIDVLVQGGRSDTIKVTKEIKSP